MRTKHLLYTLALAAGFSACTSEELVPNAPQLGNGTGAERPTISNVSLELGGEETRFVYEGKYIFTEGDTISALLMDENNTGIRYGVTTSADQWKKLTWLERYHLVDYVHTNYPFELTADKKLDAHTNMLEGNYFLVYPYLDELNGERQIIKDISVQTVEGDLYNSVEARRNVYAKNQFMIGYSKLDAGKGATSIKAELFPVLTPVRIDLKSMTNVYTDLQVTKIVLSHSNLPGVLTIDPTRAPYGYGAWANPVDGAKDWNLKWNSKKDDFTLTSWMTSGTHFNYANYLATQSVTKGTQDWEKGELYNYADWGSLNAEDYVYNITGEIGSTGDVRGERKPQTYYCDDALRAIVRPMGEYNNPEYATNFIEVRLNGEEGKQYVDLAPGKTVEAIAMMPSFWMGDEPLMLTIYTKQGVLANIDVSTPNLYNKADDDIVVHGNISRIDPAGGAIQKITVEFDNTKIASQPAAVTINNEDDLAQWVALLTQNKENTNKFDAFATFTNDITIDDDLAQAIKGLPAGYTLHIMADKNKPMWNNNLRFKTTAENADILEKLDVAHGVTIEVMDGGVLDITEKSYNIVHEWKKLVEVDCIFGRLNIEVEKGGTLNITNNDQKSIMAGYDAAGKPIQNRTEATIWNKMGGTLNVNGVENVIGFFIINAGEMNIAEDASIAFAPYTHDTEHLTTDGSVVLNEGEKVPSINTISGKITVNGEMSGTIEKNFENYGEIYQNGVVTNIINKKNLHDLNGQPKDGLKDGIIYIGSTKYTDENGEEQTRVISTGLISNEGTVDYQSNLIAVIKENYGGAFTGVFKYTGPGVGVSALNNARVTDATITSGTLRTDICNDGAESTVKNLKLDGSAEKVTVDKVWCAYHQTNHNVLRLANNEGKIEMIADVDVNGIAFKGIKMAYDEAGELLNEENVILRGQDIKFANGTTSFFGRDKKTVTVEEHRKVGNEYVYKKTSVVAFEEDMLTKAYIEDDEDVVPLRLANTDFAQATDAYGEPIWSGNEPVYLEWPEKYKNKWVIVSAGTEGIIYDKRVKRTDFNAWRQTVEQYNHVKLVNTGDYLMKTADKPACWGVEAVIDKTTTTTYFPAPVYFDACQLYIASGATMEAREMLADKYMSKSTIFNGFGGTIWLKNEKPANNIEIDGNQPYKNNAW